MVALSLQALMIDRGITSFKALSVKAQVSLGAVRRLHQGHILTMQMQTIAKISGALELSIDELVRSLTKDLVTEDSAINNSVVKNLVTENPVLCTTKSTEQPLAIQQEYDRLLQRLDQQEYNLREIFRRDALQILEPWLLQWSAAAHAAHTNSQLPAAKLLPLLKPIEKLLEEWGLQTIAIVGETLGYDPTLHEVMDIESSKLQVGDQVRVRFSGYRYGGDEGELLYRVKVMRVQAS